MLMNTACSLSYLLHIFDVRSVVGALPVCMRCGAGVLHTGVPVLPVSRLHGAIGVARSFAAAPAPLRQRPPLSLSPYMCHTWGLNSVTVM